MEPTDSLEKLAKRIIDDLNDRSGVNIDFDGEIMAEIYHEIAMKIATGVPVIFEEIMNGQINPSKK